MMILCTIVNDKRIAYDDIHDARHSNDDRQGGGLSCPSRPGVWLSALVGAVMSAVAEKEWEDRVKGLLKAELKRKGVTYAELVGKLADIGVMDSEPNVRNKISRGKFTAVFLVQCMTAIGVTDLRL